MTRAALLLALSALGCTVGEGTGEVRSEKLYVEDCWNGPFDLKPDFFGANPYREEQLLIRVQRGDNIQEASDGLTVLLADLQSARDQLGVDIPVGLPRGVTPPGVPVEGLEDPPTVSLSLYLHQTCHEQNAAIYSVSGTINFSSLFSGDPAESSSDERLSEATFDVQFADPRQLAAGEDPAEVQSRVTGNFRFFFQRGQPAQPFQ